MSKHCQSLFKNYYGIKVKFSKKQVKLQGQGHRVRNIGVHGKNTHALAFTIISYWQGQRIRQSYRIMERQNDIQDKNNMPPNL